MQNSTLLNNDALTTPEHDKVLTKHPLNRYQACGIHFLITLVVLSTILGTLIPRFYPDYFFSAEGGWRFMQILIGVDLVLGPTLTLLLFKPGKKGLKFDLFCIATVQLAALIYGCTVIYTARPVYAVFASDRFEIISAAEIDLEKIKDPGLINHFYSKPKLAYVYIEDKKVAGDIMMGAMSGGNDIQYFPEYYQPFHRFLDEAFKKSRDVQPLLKTPEDKQIYNQFMADYDQSKDDLGFFPIMGKQKDMLAVVDRKTGLIITALDISPYKY